MSVELVVSCLTQLDCTDVMNVAKGRAHGAVSVNNNRWRSVERLLFLTQHSPIEHHIKQPILDYISQKLEKKKENNPSFLFSNL